MFRIGSLRIDAGSTAHRDVHGIGSHARAAATFRMAIAAAAVDDPLEAACRGRRHRSVFDTLPVLRAAELRPCGLVREQADMAAVGADAGLQPGRAQHAAEAG